MNENKPCSVTYLKSKPADGHKTLQEPNCMQIKRNLLLSVKIHFIYWENFNFFIKISYGREIKMAAQTLPSTARKGYFVEDDTDKWNLYTPKTRKNKKKVT